MEYTLRPVNVGHILLFIFAEAEEDTVLSVDKNMFVEWWRMLFVLYVNVKHIVIL